MVRAALIVTGALMFPPAVSAQSVNNVLESTTGLRLHNVAAEPVTYEGRRGLRLTVSDDARRAVSQLPANQQYDIESFAVIDGTDFSNGVIEAEISGSPAADAGEGARGFVGIAFRMRDSSRYDAFYLRPTNGRADDQLRRNHSVQYISHPEFPWERLRRETPGVYESYADLVPGVWTKVRIEVRGEKARLFVNGQAQPVLVVNDVKSGAQAHGAVALWIGPGTVAHFRNLQVSP